MSLIALQEKALARMQESRTSEKREAKNCRAALRRYHAQATALGYTAEQVQAQIKDIRDMHQLLKICAD